MSFSIYTHQSNNCDYVVLQDEKNQMMKSNVWLQLVNIILSNKS